MIKVSVIVPVYNVEKYLKKCLDSLVNQTLKDIEIIVVNDGSPDNSQEIINKYTKKYKNIRSFKKNNEGQGGARNYGIKEAIGEYVSFVDSDDYIEKNMLEEMYTKAKEEDLDIVVCNINEVSTNKTRVLKSRLIKASNNIKSYIISNPSACNKLYKRNIFDDEFKFSNNIFYEDLCLIPTLIIKAKKVGFIEKAFYDYYQRENSTMHQEKFTNKLLDIFKVLENIENMYKKYSLYEKYYSEIEYLYLTNLLRSATLRFIDYNNTEKYLKKINNIILEKFPNWKYNIYFKNSNFKLKIICKLAIKEKYKILKIIKKTYGR